MNASTNHQSNILVADIFAILSGYITRPCIIRMITIINVEDARYNLYYRRYRSPSIIKTKLHQFFKDLKYYRDSYIYDYRLYKLDRDSTDYIGYYSNGMISKISYNKRFSLSIMYTDYIVISKVTWICLSGHRYNTRLCSDSCDMDDGGWSYMFYIDGELKDVESESDWDILRDMYKRGRFLY